MKICIGCNTLKPLIAFSPKGNERYHARCKTCRSAEYAAYYAVNRDKELAKSAKWSSKNKDRRKSTNRARYENKRDEIRAATAKYSRENRELVCAAERRRRNETPERSRALVAERRAARYKATPAWANLELMQETYELSELCARATGIAHHVDHIVPLKSKIVCGLHNQFNLQILPAKMNLSKGNKYWPDMP